jgi:hypothetical protein
MSHLKENNLTPKITVLAITLNEEERKKYVKAFADEIILLMATTDATTAPCKELGVTVIQRTLMILQHNVTLHYSNPITTGFSFDLDEKSPRT